MHNSNRENINKISEEELAAITEAYPFYSLAQWWLLSTYKETRHKNLDRQASVTSLFFNNQKWLNWQLSRPDFPEKKKDVEIITVSLENNYEKPQEFLVNNKQEEITFEPLHTVDYFASQGIKVSEEALVYDKLGTQLKSFTEWLKSMKKIHAEKLTGGDEQTDKTIQQIAESSNTNIDVITESMAEVLLKQGKIDQAIEIYNKLSLNYPSGSAYFAAKINSLKPV